MVQQLCTRVHFVYSKPSIAAYNNSCEAIRLLIDSKAIVSDDKRGFTALHHAALRGHLASLQLILSYPEGKSKIDLRDHKGNFSNPNHFTFFQREILPFI